MFFAEMANTKNNPKHSKSLCFGNDNNMLYRLFGDLGQNVK